MDTAYKLSMYLAAAVPLRFGFSGRRSLLATIATSDRLSAVATVIKSHPPVLRSQVVEFELLKRRRVGNSVIITPASLESICIDALASNLEATAVDVADANVSGLGSIYTPSLVQAVVDRSCQLQLMTRAALEIAVAPVTSITRLTLDGEGAASIVTLSPDWMPAVRTMHSLSELVLTRCAKLTDAVLGAGLRELPLLDVLSVERCRSLTGTFLYAVQNPAGLAALNVAGTKTTATIFETSVSSMVGLKALNVSGTRWNDKAALAILPKIGQQLQQFDCESTKITDSSAPLLAALSNATSISVCFSEHLYEFEWIRLLSTIRVLDLSLCARLGDEHLTHLIHLESLREINISKTEVTDNGFRYLAGLGLEKIVAQSLEITDAIVYALQKLPDLIHLDLSLCLQVTDAVVGCLDPDKIERLDLPYKPTGTAVVTNAAVQLLVDRGFSKLRSLSIGGKGIDDSAFEWMAMLPSTLCVVKLWHTKVTVAGLARFREATGLALDDAMATSRGTYMLCL